MKKKSTIYLMLLLTGCLHASVTKTKSASSLLPPDHENKHLSPYAAFYSVEINGLKANGTAESQLIKKNEGWSLSFQADAFLMSYKETSSYILKDKTQVQPLQYKMEKSVLGSDKKTTVDFDWKKSAATYNNEKKDRTVDIQSGDLDDLSYQTQLRLDLISNKKKLSYMVIEKNQREPLSFEIDGQETLKTELGLIPAVRLKTQRQGNKRQTWIWLAKDWEYLPVQIQQIEGAASYLMKLTGGTMNNIALKGKADTQQPGQKESPGAHGQP